MKQFEDGDPCFAPMLNALFAAFRGTAVMDGCEASATGTSRAVSITAGSAQVNGVEVAVGAGSVTLDAGGVFDRYDLISVNAAGSKIVTKGVAKRKCPPQPANTCLLAIVFVPAGATVIATGNVYDARMLVPHVAVGSLSATGLITGPGIHAVQKKSYAVSDTVIHNLPEERSIKGDSFGTTHAIVVPQGYMTSTFRIRFDYRMGQSKRGGLFRVLRNGREIMSTSRIYETAWTTASVDVTGVEPGDVFSLQAAATDWDDYAYTRNFQVCGEVETYTRMIGSSDTTW